MSSEPTPAGAAARALGAIAGRRRSGYVGVYAGLGLVALGFAVLAYTWGQVAAEVLVAKQLPYVVSGGLSGLGLVVVGTAVLTAQVWYTDNQRQRRELERIDAMVRSLADRA
jgi:hypothetical protein